VSLFPFVSTKGHDGPAYPHKAAVFGLATEVTEQACHSVARVAFLLALAATTALAECVRICEGCQCSMA